jgi:hypothetical protein
MLERGEKPHIPSRDQLLSSCCKREDTPGRTITYLKGDLGKEDILEIEHGVLK